MKSPLHNFQPLLGNFRRLHRTMEDIDYCVFTEYGERDCFCLFTWVEGLLLFNCCGRPDVVVNVDVDAVLMQLTCETLIEECIRLWTGEKQYDGCHLLAGVSIAIRRLL
jgi:hypothetical protein